MLFKLTVKPIHRECVPPAAIAVLMAFQKQDLLLLSQHGESFLESLLTLKAIPDFLNESKMEENFDISYIGKEFLSILMWSR